MRTIEIEKISLLRDESILKDMDRFVDWNMSAHPLMNLVKISQGGAFVARLQETNVGMIFAFPYANSVGWIAFLVVNPSYQRKGIGTALMKKAISFLQSKEIRSIGLYATEDGTPLYERIGFVKSLTSARFTISGKEKLFTLKKKLNMINKPISFELREFSHADHQLLNQIISFDNSIFEANRKLIFENRFKMGSWNCVCALKNTNFVAFGMWRLIDNYFGFIGPLMGLESPVFQEVLPRIILRLIENAASSIYIGTNSSVMKKWLNSHNFSLGEQSLLMYLGKIPKINEQMWAICHPSKG